ncbi:selection and upkeep of intraepithelial T-cells protein 7-like [Haplochromis burtoni]|uniref:selection and upkeep of intraepithelial T-cells protein 7-like n=1 Tax=Haplochromis burtoni TaxID=8153 RepID=UPI001C2CD048|nr:selection and upkeep of intraepithelial T-cells protein 7-like [Haplochromis burtoni]
MSHRTFTSFCLIFLFVNLFVFVSTDQKNITAQSGKIVTLPCRAPNNNIISVEWSRADLGDEYVLLYRNNKMDPVNQHPSFKNRVDLQDRQMKDGDVSLILNNVTMNDTGTYECRVIQEEREGLKLINTTYVHVVPPGQTGGDTEDGSVGLIVGLSVVVVAVVVVVVVLVLWSVKCRNHTKGQSPSPYSDQHLCEQTS